MVDDKIIWELMGYTTISAYASLSSLPPAINLLRAVD